jgi:NADPH-dependent curcumin reductase CurA
LAGGVAIARGGSSTKGADRRVFGCRLPARYHEAQTEIGAWIDQGKIKYKIDERKGFDILPETINCLFEGNHDGRLLVELTDEDNGPA